MRSEAKEQLRSNLKWCLEVGQEHCSLFPPPKTNKQKKPLSLWKCSTQTHGALLLGGDHVRLRSLLCTVYCPPGFRLSYRRLHVVLLPFPRIEGLTASKSYASWYLLFLCQGCLLALNSSSPALTIQNYGNAKILIAFPMKSRFPYYFIDDLIIGPEKEDCHIVAGASGVIFLPAMESPIIIVFLCVNWSSFFPWFK